MAGKPKKTPTSPAPTIPSDPLSAWPPLPTPSVVPTQALTTTASAIPVTTTPAVTTTASAIPVTFTSATSVATTLHPQAPAFVPPLLTLPLPSSPAVTASPPVTVSPSVIPSSVPHLPSTLPPPTDTALLYSPTVGISPFSSHSSTETDPDSIIRELRSSMAYCMDRFYSQEAHIVTLSRHYEDLVARLNSVVTQQSAIISDLTAKHTWTQENLTRIATWTQDYSRDMDARLQKISIPDSVSAPVAEIQEKIATIQTEVQRHSDWVEVARKKPPPVRPATVSETLAESDRRAQRSLNLRIRGIERSDTVPPMQQAQDFVTQTMGITDHGVVSAYRAGTDTSREQPLIIRFRDAETRLAVLRRRSRLRDSPQIHLDEDLTPLQWQDYRALLPQRHAARQEGLWAVIRDGRLITRPLRTAQPAPTSAG